MPGQGFLPQDSGTGVPVIAELIYDSSATFKAGALVVVAADGELEECGTDPTAIKGIALSPAGEGPGFKMANQPSITPTYRKNAVSVALARNLIIVGRGINGSDAPVTPTQTQVGESFGVAKDSKDIWCVDISETSDTRVEIVKVDIPNKLYFFKIKAANVQE